MRFQHGYCVGACMEKKDAPVHSLFNRVAGLKGCLIFLGCCGVALALFLAFIYLIPRA